MADYVSSINYTGHAVGFCDKHGCSRNACRRLHGDFSNTPYRENRALQMADALAAELDRIMRSGTSAVY